MSLLRRGPQDLPYSPALLGVILAGSLLVGAIGTAGQLGGFGRAFLAGVLDAAVVAVMVYATLRFVGHGARLVQTLTAVFGVSLLFTLVMLLLQGLTAGMRLEELILVASLVPLAWFHVVLGHVLRHALGIELWAGIGVAVAYTVIGLVIVSSYFPSVEVAGN